MIVTAPTSLSRSSRRNTFSENGATASISKARANGVSTSASPVRYAVVASSSPVSVIVATWSTRCARTTAGSGSYR